MIRLTIARRSHAAVMALIVTAGAVAAEPARTDSPFLPSPNAAPAGNVANAAYTLVGMTVVRKETLVGVTRSSDKRSFWIPVGKTVGEITVVSYDSKTDQAVIRANGKLETLTMKKSVVIPGALIPVTAAPAASPAAAAQPPVDVPTTAMSAQEEKEMEARMLVTDLLEIGQRQRKAYEEAQRQAAAKNAGKPPVPAKP